MACSSSEEGFFLSTDEEVAVELSLAADSEAIGGRFWLFPGPSPFADERGDTDDWSSVTPP